VHPFERGELGEDELLTGIVLWGLFCVILYLVIVRKFCTGFDYIQ
jgi:hypothetical protein